MAEELYQDVEYGSGGGVMTEINTVEGKDIVYALESFIAGLDDAVPQEEDGPLIKRLNKIINKLDKDLEGEWI